MLNRIEDKFGFLLPISFREFNFLPKRIFVVGEVPSGTIRGDHAHKTCHQLLICVAGEIMCETIDSRGNHESVKLNSVNNVLYMPPMTWGRQTYVSSKSLLLVVASHEYDESDYIRNWETFSNSFNVNSSEGKANATTSQSSFKRPG